MAHSRKRVVINIDEHQHADLVVKLHEVGLKQTKIIRAFLDGYLKDDKLIRTFIEKYKETNKVYSKVKRKKQQKMRDKSEKLEELFNLDNKEIDNIFDIIENAHPELK